jgi:hypothetical protein
MNKRYLLLVLPLLIIALVSTSYAWQGRMAGMGDPYGLIADEADFLIHPAKIAQGEGVRFYGNYRFTYTGLLERAFAVEEYLIDGTLVDAEGVNISGGEYGHEALLGAAFPLGPGRMGLFFTYTGLRGAYEGTEYDPLLTPDNWEFGDVEDAFDDFAFRLLYGLPLGGFTLGGEVQIAYRREEEGNYMYEADLSEAEVNEIGAIEEFSYGSPHDSSYWEALLKGSLEGNIGPADYEFTLRGGFIFCGDNEWYYEYQFPMGTPVFWIDHDGDVEGWRVGGDLWIRYPLAEDRSLPFLVRIDYHEKTRDGDGVGEGAAALPVDDSDYQHKTQNIQVEVGGGLDREFNAGSRFAVGIYYNYLMNKDVITWTSNYGIPGVAIVTDDEEDIAPYHTEHRVLLRLAGEHEFSPRVALRAGVNIFYGWARWEAEDSWIEIVNLPFVTFVNNDECEFSADGPHWGIGASVGASVRFQRFTLEPFVTGGYQDLSLDGDGTNLLFGMLDTIYEGNFDQRMWYISGGMSVLFDVP